MAEGDWKRESVSKIKVGESEKRKAYRCRVEAPFEVTDWIKTMQAALPMTVTLAQRTPERVQHRRADLVRHRQVTLTAMMPAEHPNQFILTLDAEAGTYIKEFVHGDRARTSPSLYEALSGVCPPPVSFSAPTEKTGKDETKPIETEGERKESKTEDKSQENEESLSKDEKFDITHLDVTAVVLPWPTPEDCVAG